VWRQRRHGASVEQQIPSNRPVCNLPVTGEGSLNLAVSEVVGTIILVGVVMVGMALVGILLLSNPTPSNVPVSHFIISNASNTVYIYHKGGDPLYTGQYQILVDGGDQTGNFTIMSPGTQPWGIGETLSNTTPNMPKHIVIVFNQSGRGGTVLAVADLIGAVTIPPLGGTITTTTTTAPPSAGGTYYLYNQAQSTGYLMAKTQPSGTGMSDDTDINFFTSTFGGGEVLNSGTTDLYLKLYVTGFSSRTFRLYLYYVDTGGTSHSLGSYTGSISPQSKTLMHYQISSTGHTFAVGERLQFEFTCSSSRVSLYWDGSDNTSRIVTP